MKNRKILKLGLLSLLMILSGSQLLSCNNKNKKESISFSSIPSSESISYNSPDVVPEVKTLGFFGKKFELEYGEFRWFKFTAPETKKYYICSTGGDDIVIDLFENVVNGYSMEGLIESYQGGFIAKPLVDNSLEESFGCYFSIVLNIDQTIYLRVRKFDYESCESGRIYIGEEPFIFAEDLQR